MLDSKEMAKAALRRADEIKVNKKRKRRLWEAAGILVGVCAVTSVIAITILPVGPSADYIFFDGEQLA